MVKQPQALPLRLSRSFWASITKSEPHRMKHSIGPPDLAIDPHNSQIKVKGMGVFTFVSTAPTDQEQGFVGGFRSFLPTPHSMPSFVPHEVTTPTYFRSEVCCLKSVARPQNLCILKQ